MKLLSLFRPDNFIGRKCGGIYFSAHTYATRKKKYRKPIDPEHSDSLPEFQYASEDGPLKNRVYTWGVSAHGALGRASFVRPGKGQHWMPYKHSPHRLEIGEKFRVKDIACGYGFTVFAVKDEFKVFGTGINTDSQLGTHQPHRDHPLGLLLEPVPLEPPIGTATQVTQVACGRAHTVILTDKEGVWSLGNNAYGQCGRPIIHNEDYGRHVLYHHIKELEGRVIRQIECGQDVSLFLSSDGIVYSCGWSSDGQTGRGHYKNEPKVGALVGDIEGENIIKISCRADCALALSDKGEVFGWGNSEYQQLNSVTDEMQINTTRKLHLPEIGKVVDIVAAGTLCLAVNDDGEVFSWGYGLLGKGPKATFSKQPTKIPSVFFGRNELNPETKVVSISGGINTFAAINSDGSLFTWGKNHGGCLGLGSVKDQFFPLRVSIAGIVKKVSCGVDHMAALVRPIL
ncbi:RCC1-like G exchanging factor-like protein [Oratosquilla oratoria]|uniref:RCC1-like G exchanging factor-like protein n=1 Tax=Oratosquilla oratoria TaxID=337810 RepID=UPI003F76127D